MSDQELYRIGTVSKLTGISPECLRAWERRYNLQPAQKSGKTRFYSHEQLQNLNKIKTLIQKGHPISSLANLNTAQLNARLTPVQELSGIFNPVQAYSARLPQIGLIGTNLLILEQENGETDRLEVAQRWHNVTEFLNSRPNQINSLHTVVLYSPTLNPEEISTTMALIPDLRVIVVYQYASPQRIDELKSQGAPLLAWPISWDQLISICVKSTEFGQQAGKSAPRRFDDSELLSIAYKAKQLGDDSPRHLVTLISDLNAYELYTAEHILESPDEAELLSRIREDVSFARAQLERSLGDVLATKSISISDTRLLQT
ncbi:MAG: MerR family transcriptional regulator [Pseudomonadales bacterium]|nr:MerR family transcriptional regulator [Pseudomonadales bacterium]